MKTAATGKLQYITLGHYPVTKAVVHIKYYNMILIVIS